MAYFPGDQCSVFFERDRLVWQQGATTRDIPWSEIRRVTTDHHGATVHLSKGSLLIPKSVVWYEFVIEDVIKKARQTNPSYEGPAATAKSRPLAIPNNHQEQMNYARRAQRFYKSRCPNYHEFKAFLQANQDWVFDESTFYECSLSMCSGSPVGEGYSTDLRIPASESWYLEFEKSAGTGRLRGGDLLVVLESIRPQS